MFRLENFIMQAILGMIGREPDYKVREYALGWFTKSVLAESDLATVEEALYKARTWQLTEMDGTDMVAEEEASVT